MSTATSAIRISVSAGGYVLKSPSAPTSPAAKSMAPVANVNGNVYLINHSGSFALLTLIQTK